ncbi:MAG: SUMF1/EgtB/PvdO family nonheme iron enzyme, partial [Gemmatimonadaceae bacterium]|nr:SUMF1/EgtB/PvdO family nonheme iron enzyme [Gemmatimonadaceae bacterium]
MAMRIVIFAVVFCMLSVRHTRADAPAPATQPTAAMVLIKGGAFEMGTSEGLPFEGPVHEVTVGSFWMDRHEVTVEQFDTFMRATQYKTEAEKFGWSGVFITKTGEWTKVDGADWRHPEGPESKAEPKHPVVH